MHVDNALVGKKRSSTTMDGDQIKGFQLREYIGVSTVRFCAVISQNITTNRKYDWSIFKTAWCGYFCGAVLFFLCYGY